MVNINAMNIASSKAVSTDCHDCGGDGCDWDTYPTADGVADLCATCDGTGAAQRPADNVETTEQVTVCVRGKARIAGLLLSSYGDTVRVATRYGVFTRSKADMLPMDAGCAMNAAALDAIRAKIGQDASA